MVPRDDDGQLQRARPRRRAGLFIWVSGAIDASIAKGAMSQAQRESVLRDAKERCTMVSTWWLMVAFVVGIYAGVSLMAVLYLAARRDNDNAVTDFPDAV